MCKLTEYFRQKKLFESDNGNPHPLIEKQNKKFEGEGMPVDN